MVARRRLLDGNGNMNVAADIAATKSDLTSLYAGAVDAKGGTVRLYTDAGLTTPAANLTGVIVAYWYPAPLKGSVQADGTFVPESTTILTGSSMQEWMTQNQHVSASAITRYFGASVGTTSGVVTPFNVKDSRFKAVHVRNNYNTALFVQVSLVARNVANTSPAILHTIPDLESIAAGASKYYLVKDFPVLQEALNGLIVTTYTAGDAGRTGSHDIILLARRD